MHKVHVNGRTFTLDTHRDSHDDERWVCAVYYLGCMLSVGDGACADSAEEDAMWDALSELAPGRESHA